MSGTEESTTGTGARARDADRAEPALIRCRLVGGDRAEDDRAEDDAGGASGRGGEVLLLTIDNPPLNGLTGPVRAALAEVLDAEAAREAGPRPLVITGGSDLFSAAGFVEAGEAVILGRPGLGDICRCLDAWPAPVVAAVSGRASGPGAELALACHARIMATGARISFPEAGLGLTPMAGSSQRLPRLVGAGEALALFLQAKPIGGEEALAIGLADHVTEGDPVPAAIRLAQSMTAPRPVTQREDGLRDVAAFRAAIAAARREQLRNPMPAPGRIIDCVDAALYLPPENGFAMEEVTFADLLETGEARGLIASAQAARIAHRLPQGVASAVGEDLRVLGLAGAGPQLAALALLALGRGMRVIWAGPEGGGDAAALERTAAWLRERLEAETRAGRLSQAQRDSDLLRFETGRSAQALREAALVVHAQTGPALEEVRRLSPAALHLVIGGARGMPGMTIAPSGRICEISAGGAASPQALASLWRLMQGLGLQPVLSGGQPQIGRRVVAAGVVALRRMLEMGVPRRLIVSALTGFGQVAPDLPDPAGEVAMRAMSGEEVLRRWLGAMANEGYRLIADAEVQGPELVDFLLVQGHGFPRWRGGPMHQAASRGAMVLRSELRRWQEDDPVWQPDPILDRLVSEGRGAGGRGRAA